MTKTISSEIVDLCPWKAEQLFEVPAIEEVAADFIPDMRSFLYEGIPWKGKPTKIFARFGKPTGTPPPGGWPAVVCVHGGGGTAHPEWIRAWNAHGYAALAMDLEGHLGDAKTSFDGSGPARDMGGPPEEAAKRFYRSDEPVNDLWFYQAISQIARAHSLLRAWPEIDSENIGLAGLSWGGVLASVTVGIDPRYKFAVIFYGCGFLHESDSYMRELFSISGNPVTSVPFEPSRYLPQSKIPILWVNGTNDLHFPVDSWQRSASSTLGPRTMRLIVRMDHGPDSSWSTPEVFVFADDVIKKQALLPVLGQPEMEDGRAIIPLLNKVSLKSAVLNYTRDSGVYSAKVWETSPATMSVQQVISVPLPEGVVGWSILVTDHHANRISSDYVMVAAKK